MFFHDESGRFTFFSKIKILRECFRRTAGFSDNEKKRLLQIEFFFNLGNKPRIDIIQDVQSRRLAITSFIQRTAQTRGSQSGTTDAQDDKIIKGIAHLRGIFFYFINDGVIIDHLVKTLSSFFYSFQKIRHTTGSCLKLRLRQLVFCAGRKKI